MMALVQSSFQTTWASLFEMEREPNRLEWNVHEVESKLELEDMKRTQTYVVAKKMTRSCQKTYENKMFVDLTQQCFALITQVNFPDNILNFHLTAVSFETGAMSTPTKSQNRTNCGWGGLFQSYLTYT